MKKSIKTYLSTRFKNIKLGEDDFEEQVDPLSFWPDLKLCVEAYYNSQPELKQHHCVARQRIEFKYTDKFLKSLDRYCTTSNLKLKLIDALTRKVYGIPSSGLRDSPIKERPGLWHFYISYSWRVFYRKEDDYFLFEELCPHRKIKYHRRT